MSGTGALFGFRSSVRNDDFVAGEILALDLRQ